MSDFNKELAVLSHLDEIHKLLIGDEMLAATVAQKVETMAIGKSTRGIVLHGRRSWSYYTERHALALKPTLDKMLDTGLPQQFLLAEHPHTNLRTLYLKVYQPWIWLMDHHADKEKYAALKKNTYIHQKKDACIRILFHAAVDDTLKSMDVNAEMDSLLRIQNKISDFLALPIDADTLFDEKKLSLTPEQINQIKDSMAGLPAAKVILMIDTNRIRILRKV